jgi:hypothetical protein
MMAGIRPTDEDEQWHFVVTANGEGYGSELSGPRTLTRYGRRNYDLLSVIVSASAVPNLSTIKNRHSDRDLHFE